MPISRLMLARREGTSRVCLVWVRGVRGGGGFGLGFGGAVGAGGDAVRFAVQLGAVGGGDPAFEFDDLADGVGDAGEGQAGAGGLSPLRVRRGLRAGGVGRGFGLGAFGGGFGGLGAGVPLVAGGLGGVAGGFHAELGQFAAHLQVPDGAVLEGFERAGWGVGVHGVGGWPGCENVIRTWGGGGGQVCFGGREWCFAGLGSGAGVGWRDYGGVPALQGGALPGNGSGAMRVVWAAVALVATLGLGLVLFVLVARVDVSAAGIVAVCRSAPWRWMRGGVMFVRGLLGATPFEDNETLLGDVTMGVCVAVAAVVVWTGNVVIRRAVGRGRWKAAGRVAA